MAGPQITMWQLPRVLLELVPESATLIAQAAVESFDINPDELELPSPPGPEETAKMPSVTGHPYFQALNAEVGSRLRSRFSPYDLASDVFQPVFYGALDADPVDEDLVKRCCEFIELALAAEEHAADGVYMMVIDNIGSEYASRVAPFAGPAFREALRSSGWIT